jgi:N-acetylneuraminate synthase
VSAVAIAGRPVGPGNPCFVVAEIGINHNGDVELARQLVDAAVDAGADAVKFQKRTVDVVYSQEELSRPKESPWGDTYGDYAYGREFGDPEYEAIDAHCRERGIAWFASCWDEGSVDFIERFAPPCYKLASASLTDDALLLHHRSTGRPLILSTGMSTVEQIDHAVEVIGREDLVLLHTTSTYPSKFEELNLAAMETLRARYDGVPIGYSGHEVGLVTSVVAAALGAVMVERHLTLDRAMWGSDQAASVEPHGFKRLVRDIRVVETARGDGVKAVYESERASIARLRRVGA